ncbi:anti-sigma factor [Simiduia aestuariiviva]|uniref:Anti-sigma-K factor RskA n=1 Tax=Simiduia aestuariiviva TaxID=1510459 RepID=A0A839UUH3_9GAMM|nr:anti-sigma factor [Simiduia aestuariiviva]MBB3169027.1 anti-sigma-K factor RskA [Simiduia aestuariiviva]
MNYLLPERREALAAEYALGTLSGLARARFQRLMMQHAELRSAVWRWENYFNELGATLPEQTPAAHVWQGIAQRLGFVPAKSEKSHWSLARWLSGAIVAAALVLAVLVAPNQHQPMPSQLALFQNADSQPLWLVQLQSDLIKARATPNVTPSLTADFELWMVPSDGSAPISLGLLPESGSRELLSAHRLVNVAFNALAISQEPPGGSPTGQPTQVLYVAQLVAI